MIKFDPMPYLSEELKEKVERYREYTKDFHSKYGTIPVTDKEKAELEETLGLQSGETDYLRAISCAMNSILLENAVKQYEVFAGITAQETAVQESEKTPFGNLKQEISKLYRELRGDKSSFFSKGKAALLVVFVLLYYLCRKAPILLIGILCMAAAVVQDGITSFIYSWIYLVAAVPLQIFFSWLIRPNIYKIK